MTYKVALAIGLTVFVLVTVILSARDDEDSTLGDAVLGGLVFGVVIGALAAVWVWAVS